MHGILLQHPAPRQIDERCCFERIALSKDVDGVTMLGFGRMAMGEPAYGSATLPASCVFSRTTRSPLEGRHAVVVGRSPILGKPVAMMLLNANATVTICHSKTQGLAEIVRSAEIVVGAVGKPEFIKALGFATARWSWMRAIIRGTWGMWSLPPVIDRCSAYTPVPGGVGPMTIATLITQTVISAEGGL